MSKLRIREASREEGRRYLEFSVTPEGDVSVEVIDVDREPHGVDVWVSMDDYVIPYDAAVVLWAWLDDVTDNPYDPIDEEEA